MKQQLNKACTRPSASKRRDWIIARLFIMIIICLPSAKLWAWKAPSPAVRIVDQLDILDIFDRQRLTGSILHAENQSNIPILFLILSDPRDTQPHWVKKWRPYPVSTGPKLMLITNADLNKIEIASVPPLKQEAIETIKTAFFSATEKSNQPAFAKRASLAIIALGPILAEMMSPSKPEPEMVVKSDALLPSHEEAKLNPESITQRADNTAQLLGSQAKGKNIIGNSLIPWIVLVILVMAVLWVFLDRLRASLDQTNPSFLGWWLITMTKKTQNSRQSDQAGKKIEADR